MEKSILGNFIKSHSRFVVILWLGVLLATVVTFVLVLSVFSKQSAQEEIHQELQLKLNQLHNFQIQLYRREHDLSRFHITLESRYLRDYLKQVNANPTLRWQGGNRSTISADFNSLNNQLLDQEIHIVKLLFQGHQVPKELMPQMIVEFRLSEEESLLSKERKLVLAHDMLWSQATELLYNDFHHFIAQQENKLKHLSLNHKQAFDKVLSSLYGSIVLVAVLLVILLLMILWIRIAEVDQKEEEVDHHLPSNSIFPKFGDEQ